jgi:hypothetical protein
MPENVPDKTSLRALIHDRKAKQIRPSHRHLFTLSPQLYIERVDLEQALEDLPKAKPPATDAAQRPRLNGDPRARLEQQLVTLDQQIADSTVAVVFKALDADSMAAKAAGWERAKLKTLDQAKDLILVCFDRFDTDEELSKDDLIDLVDTLTQGEVYGLSNILSNLSLGEIDIPKSVRQSVTTQRSGATSKRA